MKTSQRIGLSLAAGAGAAAFTYAGLATAAWLRYGHQQPIDHTLLLDNFMPEPEVLERHEIHVKAPAEIAYEAARNVDLTQSRLARLIFVTRETIMCAPPEENELPKGLLGQVKALGWRILDEAPGREIVIGAAAKPWLADPEFRGLDDFAAFAEPGWAKIAWNFSIEPMSETRCVVRTETRVVTTDETSRQLFRRYWAVASPGVAVIRRVGLRLIKRAAEKV